MLGILSNKPTEAFWALTAWLYAQLSVSAAPRWRNSVIPIPDCTVSLLMDKTDPAHTQTHKCGVEAPLIALTGGQLGFGPAVLWEMTLFGSIKVRLCVDTPIHMIITLWGILSVWLNVYSLPIKSRGATHSHTTKHVHTHMQLLSLMGIFHIWGEMSASLINHYCEIKSSRTAISGIVIFLFYRRPCRSR